jgi:hypothetical protein
MIRTPSAPIDRLTPRRLSDRPPASIRGRDRLPGRLRRRPILEDLEPRIALSGTWTPLAHAAPDNIGTMILLSDGTVMAQGGGGDLVPPTNAWYRLTPSSSGSYAKGTWTSLASMHVPRLYYGSSVLPDGRVFVVGGEDTTPGSAGNTGEIYNPVSNSWSNTANFPQSSFGDDPTEVLPNGDVLGGYIFGPQTYIYNPASNSWSSGGTKLHNDQSDEETWVKLPDNSILSYDIFGDTGAAQRYIPSQNQWVSAGTVPVALTSSAVAGELGPGFLLPDGRVFLLGATGHTAFYSLSTNSWTAGPDIPDGLGCDDAPGAMMRNGDVLFAADKPASNDNPTTIFEFNPTTGQYTNVTPSGTQFSSSRAFPGRMLVLPSGQVLVSPGNTAQLYVYTPSGSSQSSWLPTISSITANSNGSFLLTGTQLNGLSEGAGYGDDAQMASNYPLVRLADSQGNEFYARTFNWSSTGVATGGASVSTDFALPAGIPGGQYSLYVVANGILSKPVPFTVSAPAVELSGSFNRTGIATDGSTFTGGGIDGNGYALSVNLLGSAIAWNGQEFHVGPALANDVVSASGQTIALPAGNDSQLMFLAAGVNGNQTGLDFQAKYTDGTSTTFTQSISDWGSPQSYPGESIAVTMNYRDTQNGGKDQTLPHFYIYGYTFNLNSAKTVASITLPSDANLELLAIDLIKGAGSATASSRPGFSGNPIRLIPAPSINPIVTMNGTRSVPRGPIRYASAAAAATASIDYGWIPQSSDPGMSPDRIRKPN